MFALYAANIKIMIDRALHVAKFQALLANKNLYLPGTRDSKALYLKVDVPPNATDEQKKEILNVQDVQNHRTEICKYITNKKTYVLNIKLRMHLLSKRKIAKQTPFLPKNLYIFQLE